MAYGQLPLLFVPNAGRVDERALYLAHGTGPGVYLTQTEAVFDFRGRDGKVVLALGFIGANPAVAIEGQHETDGKVHFLIGNDPTQWRTDLPTYQAVVYRDLWPGVSLVFRGGLGPLKHEFILQPGARVEQIRLCYRGADDLVIDEDGNLQILTRLHAVTDAKPRSYQEIGGARVEVATRFVLLGREDGGREDGGPEGGAPAYGFAIDGPYDPDYPLVIDPLIYATYLGGSETDNAHAIAVDAAGNACVAGRTASPNFPTTPGAFDTTLNPAPATIDAFVTKLNPSGSALVYSTFLGGSGDDSANGIAVDADGNAYVTGSTGSADFPTTPGAFDTTFSGGTRDGFITKLNADGSGLLYSTFLGGGADDECQGIAIDAAGNAYVTGSTGSANFPTTAGAFDTTFNGVFDAFVTKLNASGSALVYSTFLGGSATDGGWGIAVDAAGNAYVAGGTASANFPTTPGAFDPTFNGGAPAFVTKLNASGSALVYSTFLGNGGGHVALGIAVDAAGNAYVTGLAGAADFPTTPGAFDTTFNGGVADAFVTKLNASGSALVYSTFLGGTGNDSGAAIAIDAAGHAYVTGRTGSADFPTTPGAFDTTLGGDGDAFVTKLDPSGSFLVFSSFLGGTASDDGQAIAVDAAGNAYVAGFTRSSDFPTTPGAFDPTYGGAGDAFVAKIEPTPAVKPPTPQKAGVGLNVEAVKPHKVGERYVYAVKFICGQAPPDHDPLVQAIYRTDINVVNPACRSVRFTKRVVIALPERSQQRGQVSARVRERLGPGQAMAIDCTDLCLLLGETRCPDATFRTGYLLIETRSRDLEVVAVYTALNSNR